MTTPIDDLYDPSSNSPASGTLGRAEVEQRQNAAIRYLNGAKVDLSLIQAIGDLLVGSGVGTVQRLGQGSSGQVLQVGDGGPQWTDLSGEGLGFDAAGAAATAQANAIAASIPVSTLTALGDLIVGSGAGTATRLAAGSAGQVLQPGGDLGVEWVTPPASVPLAMFGNSGDLLVGSGVDSVVRLALGAQGFAFRAGSGAPVWIKETYNVRAFGAVGDGVTDDTAAINAAIVACNAGGGGIVFLPNGVYLVSTITMLQGVVLAGSEPTYHPTGTTRLVGSSLTADIISASTGDIAIRDLNIIGKTGNTAGWGINLNNSSYVMLERVAVSGTWGGISAGGSNSELILNHVSCGGHTGAIASGAAGISAVGVSGLYLFNTGVGSSMEAAGLLIDSTNTVTAVNFGAVHCANSLVVKGTTATPRFLYFHNFQSDHCENTAVVLSAGEDVKFIGGLITSSGRASGDGATVTSPGHGIDLAGFNNQLDIVGMTITSNPGMGINGQALTAGNCTSVQLIGVKIIGCGGASGTMYPGITLTAATHWQIIGGIIGNVAGNTSPNQSYAVVCGTGGGVPADILMLGVNLNGNATAPFQSGHTGGLVVKSCPGWNPVGFISIAVPASNTAVAADAYDRMFYITAGASTVTCNVTNANGTNQTVATIPSGGFGGVLVPARSTFTPIYTAAPTWTVQGN